MYATTSYRDASAINEAMGRVYSQMGIAVFISMLVSYYVGTSQSYCNSFLQEC